MIPSRPSRRRDHPRRRALDGVPKPALALVMVSPGNRSCLRFAAGYESTSSCESWLPKSVTEHERDAA